MKKTLFFFLFVCLVHPYAESAPVNNDVALTVFDEQILIREQVIYHKKSSDPSPLNEKIDHLKLSTVFAYGVTQDVSVQLTIPFETKEITQTIGGVARRRKTTGLGDLKFLTKYEFYEKDGLGKTSNAHFVAGLEIPTGDTSDEDSVGKLDRDLQLGKGTWNPIVGVAYNWETFRHEFDASISYMFHPEARGYEFGDMLHHNLSYQFRIWPWSLKGRKGLPGYFFLGFELNGIWHQKDQQFGREIDNTGEYVLYGSPTLQYISRRVIWESSIQLPLINAVNGEQSESDFIMRTGLRIQF